MSGNKRKRENENNDDIKPAKKHKINGEISDNKFIMLDGQGNGIHGVIIEKNYIDLLNLNQYPKDMLISLKELGKVIMLI